MSELPTYVLERTFNAPRELVWRTWTEPDLVSRWYGPNVESIPHKMDVEQGGLWLHEMKWGDNSNYQRAEYIEVSKPEKLVWLHSNADENWEVAGNPMMPDWPRILLTTVTFEENGDQTNLRLTWIPHEATEAEITCFEAAISGMNKGWNAGMALLEDLLAELQASLTA
ncbi:SRPBCC domain-containing protein [Pseudovibrio sp. JE062]|uniref:SRPBCC family protein n=1 Tax=Pseudovibrio sp. JE062 TaxID=439495 RepID=UPI000186F625|nr:SRPBCC domain-containing protein [Pseudovibrio sp. JE062]EEA93202.1 putative Hsp90 ATPase activator family protein [Pseudovibrio sp. JE062]